MDDKRGKLSREELTGLHFGFGYNPHYRYYNFIISDSFFLYLKTYQLILFDGFSYVFRTIGHPSTDKICKSAQIINRQMKSACRKIQSCKSLTNLLQDA